MKLFILVGDDIVVSFDVIMTLSIISLGLITILLVSMNSVRSECALIIIFCGLEPRKFEVTL
jgi:hypothetical protein